MKKQTNYIWKSVILINDNNFAIVEAKLTFLRMLFLINQNN